ncbi:MAG: YebC/PmpR family DNA-binding transcriptional regulator [Brevinematales bacterium]|nr:YebC/PmpR family DNA-binding transcriptional regulator [Brevinematales bacterium]
MSGHNKWANIKQRKSAQDAKRSNMFSKISREIILAARKGGGNPETNATLRAIIEKARSYNMPKDNIERSIKRGTGEIEGAAFEELTYEGYGPGGVAMIVDVTTDNRNRTISEIRKIFSRLGGNLGEAGCVGWMFEKKGYISVDANKYTEDQIMEIALELGADDVKKEGDAIEIYTSVENFLNVLDGLKAKGIEIQSSELARFAQNTVKIEKDKALSLLKLIDELEEHDDVQAVATNADIDDSVYDEFANS